MDTIQAINTPNPVAVLSCKVPLDLKGRFIGKAAENKLLPAVQLAILVDEFTKSKGGNWLKDTEREKLTDEIAKLKKQVEDAKKEAAKNASNLTANESKLNARIKALESENVSLKADKTKLTNEIAAGSKNKSASDLQLQGQITKLTNELAASKKQLEKLESEIETEKANFKKFHSQVITFRNMVIEKHNRSAFGLGNEIVEAAEAIK